MENFDVLLSSSSSLIKYINKFSFDAVSDTRTIMIFEYACFLGFVIESSNVS